MCNLYSITTNQAAIAALFRVVNRYVGNLAPMPGVFPDYPAPVVRNTDTERELTMMRWGMPPPPRTGGPPVTNVRNTSSPHCGAAIMLSLASRPLRAGTGTPTVDAATSAIPVEIEAPAGSDPEKFPARYRQGMAAASYAYWVAHEARVRAINAQIESRWKRVASR